MLSDEAWGEMGWGRVGQRGAIVRGGNGDICGTVSIKKKKNVAKQSSLVNRAREVVPSPAFLAAFLAIPPPE